ncbi:MAG: PilX N-terminal domain-containing pilus assembly protein [Nitrospira sp.]
MNLRHAHIGAEQRREVAGMKNQQGIALLTVMLMLLILTILGIASITVTSMENRMAGFFRSTEAVVAAADSCEGLAANIIQQTLSPPGVLPANFIAPAGPVPTANASTLYAEIYGYDLPSPAAANTTAVNFSDTASTAPNFVMTNLPGFTVSGDIDLLYTHAKSGQGTGVAGTEHVYRITCMASNPATGSNSTVTSVYGCLDGDTCVKKIN